MTLREYCRAELGLTELSRGGMVPVAKQIGYSAEYCYNATLGTNVPSKKFRRAIETFSAGSVRADNPMDWRL